MEDQSTEFKDQRSEDHRVILHLDSDVRRCDWPNLGCVSRKMTA